MAGENDFDAIRPEVAALMDFLDFEKSGVFPSQSTEFKRLLFREVAEYDMGGFLFENGEGLETLACLVTGFPGFSGATALVIPDDGGKRGDFGADAVSVSFEFFAVNAGGAADFIPEAFELTLELGKVVINGLVALMGGHFIPAGRTNFMTSELTGFCADPVAGDDFVGDGEVVSRSVSGDDAIFTVDDTAASGGQVFNRSELGLGDGAAL